MLLCNKSWQKSCQHFIEEALWIERIILSLKGNLEGIDEDKSPRGHATWTLPNPNLKQYMKGFVEIILAIQPTVMIRAKRFLRESYGLKAKKRRGCWLW